MATKNSWNNTISDAAVTLNGGAINIGSDAGTDAVNIGTGGARTVSIGNTTGATRLALYTGTNDFSLASATGTIINALDTGEITYPLQTAFLAWIDSIANVTGDGTVYTIVYNHIIFDQNSDFNTGTGVFTAPVTGKYYFGATSAISNATVADNNAFVRVVASNRSNLSPNFNPANQLLGGQTTFFNTFFVDMDAADTVHIDIQIGGSTKTVGLIGSSTTDLRTYLYGYLVC